jgi:MYXO-CTERM domain-containing protein
LRVRIRSVFATLLLLPAAAFAQTITSSFQTTSPSGVVSVNIGKSLCQSTKQIDFVVDYTPTGSAPTAGTDTVAFFITADASTCSDTSKDPPGTPNNVNSSQLGVFTIRTSYTVGELIAGLANGCNDATKSAATPYTVFFCARRKTSSIIGSNTLISNSLQVSFALIPPIPPSAPTSVDGDQHLRVSWTSNDAGDRTYDVFVLPRQPGVLVAPPTIDVNAVSPVATGLQQTSVDVTNASGGAILQNNQDYDVYVRSADAFANASAPSGPGTGTPFLVEDFYRHYRAEGGHASGGGGCSSGETGFLAALAAIAVLLRKRRRMAAPFLAALLCAVPAARAADWTGQNRPPRFLLVAFKMDRYDPQIDSEAGLTGRPYHDIFHGRAPARYQIEVDWQAAHPFGSILLGVTGGFWQNYGHGLDTRTNPPTVSPDTTNLDIAPFGAVVTYRFDELANSFRWLPVIPYAQAGLTAALWSSFNGRGDVSTRPTGGRGSGWSYGYSTALGVALSLDAIDPGLAREAYIDMGIQRTAAFAEYGWTRLDNFHKGGSMILTDRAWRFGVSVEF